MPITGQKFAKLGSEKATIISQLIDRGMTNREIADIFEASTESVQHIRTGASYSKVTGRTLKPTPDMGEDGPGHEIIRAANVFFNREILQGNSEVKMSKSVKMYTEDRGKFYAGSLKDDMSHVREDFNGLLKEHIKMDKFLRDHGDELSEDVYASVVAVIKFLPELSGHIISFMSFLCYADGGSEINIGPYAQDEIEMKERS